MLLELWYCPCRDTEALDTSLGNTVSMFISCLANVLGSIIVVLAVTPAVLFAIIPLAYIYRRAQVSFLLEEKDVKLCHLPFKGFKYLKFA